MITDHARMHGHPENGMPASSGTGLMVAEPLQMIHFSNVQR